MESVDEAFTVGVAATPWVVKDFGFANAGGLEGLVSVVFKIIAPDFGIVGGELIGFDVTVADRVGAR